MSSPKTINIDSKTIQSAATFFIIIVVLILPLMKSYTLDEGAPSITLAVLSGNATIGDYLPEDNTIDLDDEINWIIYIQSNLETEKKISIRIKLLNSTMVAPNATICKPSMYPTIYEIKKTISKNEILINSLKWSVLNIKKKNNSTIINKMIINGEEIELNVLSYSGNFRIVIEIWTWNDDINDYIFGFSTKKCYGPWNQIWFNI